MMSPRLEALTTTTTTTEERPDQLWRPPSYVFEVKETLTPGVMESQREDYRSLHLLLE